MTGYVPYDPPSPLWWLSFIDPSRPPGKRLLGICIVPACSMVDALIVAHVYGCNPGGECKGVPIPAGTLPDDVPIGKLVPPPDCFELACRF